MVERRCKSSVDFVLRANKYAPAPKWFKGSDSCLGASSLLINFIISREAQGAAPKKQGSPT